MGMVRLVNVPWGGVVGLVWGVSGVCVVLAGLL